jgi:hypothetical protein
MGAFAILTLLAVAMVAAPFAGCSVPDEVALDQTQENPDEICPDTLLQGDIAIFSTSIDSDGQPQDIAKTFPADAAEIFCTFTLSGDLCCSDVIVIWQHEGETVFYFSQDGTGMPDTNTVSIIRPEEGFARGEYLVKVYVSIREVISETFIIE